MATLDESQATKRMDALSLANSVRSRRAELRREVRALARPAGMVRVSSLLMGREPSIASLLPIDLLRWPRDMPRQTATNFLMAAGLRDWRSVGELTDRQVVLLAGMLRGERS